MGEEELEREACSGPPKHEVQAGLMKHHAASELFHVKPRRLMRLKGKTKGTDSTYLCFPEHVQMLR